MGRSVVPVRDIAMRLPDAGRIRIGVKVPTKGGKSRPEKIDRFRFTGPDRQALDQVAATYGGKVEPWSDPKAAPGQHQVITEANELHIALPPGEALMQAYEQWGGGGCQRRCDGETVEMLTQGRDGIDLQQAPCICDAKQVLECQLTTRLSVLLPDVRFGGTWRLDTKGHNAAAELPGMVELIRSLQDNGIVRATLRVEWRKQAVAGQTREFAVPVLGIAQSLDQLAAGHARLTQLTAGAPPVAGELGAGSSEGGGPGEGPAPQGSVAAVGRGRDADPAPAPSDPDDDVVDAVIVDGDDPADQRGVTVADISKAARRAFADTYEATERGYKTVVLDRLRHAVIWAATDGRTASLSECGPEDLPGILGRLQRIERGEVTYVAGPLDDNDGVVFRWDGGERFVAWSEFEDIASVRVGNR